MSAYAPVPRPGVRKTASAKPAATLIRHLGLVKRIAVEVQDLYSRPISVPVVPPAAIGRTTEGAHQSRSVVPDLDAA
jgi:hypothetical protein